MPRSSSSRRPPILGRAMSAILTTLPLTPAAKARAARTLLRFKKRARRLRHYSYAYVGEYQFSPSPGGSPLLLLPRHSARLTTKNRRRGSRARAVLASLFLCGGCGGGDLDVGVLDGLPPRPAPQYEDAAYGGYEEEAYTYGGEEEEGCEVEEDDEVDRRAERFIERFYREMRMQETQRLLLL